MISLGVEHKLHDTTQLEEVLQEYKVFESAGVAHERQLILGQLNELVDAWIDKMGTSHLNSKNKEEEEYNEESTNKCKARLCAFGSYRLGVHQSGGDMDLLVIGPKHATRHSFFTDFKDQLLADGRVTDLCAVTTAYVPVLKLKFNGIEIDMVYAHIQHCATIDASFDVFEDSHLGKIDEKSVLSLNGVRVTDSILQHVANVDVFRAALRLIKLWAKQRGIYSNTMGYLGGVAWAILTAYVCQAFPKEMDPVAICRNFFRLYSLWKWPAPITLCPVLDVGLGLPVWSPTIAGSDLMPVLTPVYPAMNSTFNVNQATLTIMRQEFTRASTIFSSKFRPGGGDFKVLCGDLIKPQTFFLDHKHYLQLLLTATSESEMTAWSGWVESRVRRLVMKLDGIPGVSVFPWSKSYTHDYSPESPTLVGKDFYIGMRLDKKVIDPGKQDKKIDLSEPVFSFQSMVESFPARVPGQGFRIAHLRPHQLPDSVFPMCRRPTPSKRKRKLASRGAAKLTRTTTTTTT